MLAADQRYFSGRPTIYQLLANAVLIIHVAFVLSVVGGLLLIIVGNIRGWAWVNNVYFRVGHLLAIAFVVAESWLGVLCPLTYLEMWLRRQAGNTAYSGSFIQYWLQHLLYFDAQPWVFTLAYTLFGLLVLAAWLIWPPRRRPSPDRQS